MSYENIRYEVADDGVATVTLDDPDTRLTTLALDEARYGGAITVTSEPLGARDGPFARLFRATTVRTDDFCRVAPPPGRAGGGAPDPLLRRDGERGTLPASASELTRRVARPSS